MLTVETYLGVSSISGIGLFAGEDIPKGTVIWEYNEFIDIMLSSDQIDRLSGPAKEAILAFSEEQPNGQRLLCGDNARFINHSETPNCLDEAFISIEEAATIAKHDIKKGEELTCNYHHIHFGKNLFL